MSIAETLARCEQCVMMSITTVESLKKTFPDSLDLERVRQELAEWQAATATLKKAIMPAKHKDFKALALIHKFNAFSFSSIKEL